MLQAAGRLPFSRKAISSIGHLQAHSPAGTHVQGSHVQGMGGDMQAGDDGMKQVEDEAMMGVKGVTGTDPNRDAMHEVMGHERDLILAR